MGSKLTVESEVGRGVLYRGLRQIDALSITSLALLNFMLVTTSWTGLHTLRINLNDLLLGISDQLTVLVWVLRMKPHLMQLDIVVSIASILRVYRSSRRLWL